MALTDIDGARLDDSAFYAGKNLIINGAMQLWQRGTSSTTNGYGTVDRFRPGYGGGTQTQSRVTITSGDPYDEGFRYVLRLTNTATATGTGNSRATAQRIEAQNIANSGWDYTSSSSYLTLSFWVRSSVAQEFYGYLLTSDGTSQIYPFSLGSLSADTWTKVTKTIPGNSNLQFDNNSSQGLEVVIAPFFGTDFTDSGVSVDTWAAYASGTRTPDYTNTWAGTTDATFDITGVQLELGASASAFEHTSYRDELLRCQRYYYKVVPEGNVTGFGPCAGQSSTRAIAYISFPTSMRVRPTSMEQSGTATDYYIRLAASDTTCNAVPTMHDKSTEDGAMLNVYVGSGLSAGYAAIFGANTSDGYLAFPAEL